MSGVEYLTSDDLRLGLMVVDGFAAVDLWVALLPGQWCVTF
jgi:hypothetical protein